MLNVKKKMSVLLLGLSLSILLVPNLLGTTASARDIRIIDGVTVKSSRQYILPTMKRTWSRTVVNLGETAPGRFVGINIYDNAGHSVSNYHAIPTGTRKVFSDSSVPNQVYRLGVIAGGVPTGSNAHGDYKIYGSWSPDEW